MNPREIGHHHAQVAAARSTGRWSANRKAILLALIGAWRISETQVVNRYGFTREELHEMEARRARFGCDGLKPTRIQIVQPERRAI